MEAAAPPRGRSTAWAGGRAAFGAVWQRTEGKIGLALLALFVLVVVVGPFVAPYDPLEIGAGPPLEAPSADHLLGTDELGRDVLSRILYGGASVVTIPLVAVLLAFLIGGLGGMVAGYLGGRSDMVGTRLIDVFLAMPPILMMLVVISTAGRSNLVLVIGTALVFAPRIARVLRGATKNVSVQEFVQAAQARGERTLAIVLRELSPNISPTLFVEFASRLAFAIIFVATLNFLGLGVQPPSPNWGVMVAESRGTIAVAPWATLSPAFAIGILSVAMGLIADAVTQRFGLEKSSDFLR
jgi:peptide/nickel transport system permease protein